MYILYCIINLQGDDIMKEMFISVTGFNHYFGLTPFKPGQILYCKKDPDNAYDDEAITVLMHGMGKVGYRCV